MEANGGGVYDFIKRFQQLQLQRDSHDDLIKACPMPTQPSRLHPHILPPPLCLVHMIFQESIWPTAY